MNQEDQGAIMASLDPGFEESKVDVRQGTYKSASSLPDVLSTELQSLNLLADHENNRLSFLLLDDRDNLPVDSIDNFSLKLGCDPSARAKVVSLVGNAGDGKSYALNKIFFPPDDDCGEEDNDEVFATSSAPADSCTLGVWAAFEPRNQVLVLDTEGMLGIGGNDGQTNENRRTRQLLKVLAISDVVICKTRAERIHSDLLYFLGDASKAYNDHFSSELQKMGNDDSSNTSLGPAIVLFHETRYTNVLAPSVDRLSKSPETVIRDRLVSLSQDVSAFSKIRYFGVKKDDAGGSDVKAERESFSRLRDLIRQELDDTSVRSPRSMKLIFHTFVGLNEKFSGHVSPTTNHRSFPDEYFTCQSKCSSCELRCQRQLNHEDTHKTASACVYNKSLDNKQYLCLRCYQNGRRVVVVPKASSAQESTWLGLATYAWSGSVLECRICGVIYRSRQHWFGNDTPEAADIVHTEISHIWPGIRTLQGTHNAARRLLDGVQSLSNTVSALSSAPSKSVSGWMADKIAPSYWRPNCEITNCHLCDSRLDLANKKIHHCRACGDGFCSECSDYKRAVPERGWGAEEAVRVCRDCYGPLATKAMRSKSHGSLANATDGHAATTHGGRSLGDSSEAVHARRYGEKVVGTLNNLASVVLDYPISALMDSARPAYWVPDDECSQCCVCQRAFDLQQSTSSSATAGMSSTTSSFLLTAKLHHCRQCGKGVCDDCSRFKKSVPLRGWDSPVRVCDACKVTDLPIP